MDKNVKILSLVLVSLFLVFLISGGITGNLSFAGLKFWGARDSVQDKIVPLKTAEDASSCVCTPSCIPPAYCKVSSLGGCYCAEIASVPPQGRDSGCVSLASLCLQAGYSIDVSKGDTYAQWEAQGAFMCNRACLEQGLSYDSCCFLA